MDIDEFTSRYPSKNTKRNYRVTLNKYFSVLGVDPNSYFNDNRDYEKDIEQFFQYRMNHNYAPKTINSDLGCIKVFLQHNRVDLPSIVWKDIRRRMGGTRARTQDKNLKPEELKVIMSHLDVRGRAFFLTMASSGMRIGELPEVTFGDMHLDEDPCRIVIRGNHTKTGDTRTAFISQEAKELILEWLKVRTDYIKSARRLRYKFERRDIEDYKRLNEDIKNLKDDRVFPFGEHSAREMWNQALEDAGLEDRDKDTNHRTLHPHSLRQFFRTNAGVVVNTDVAEALIGHEQGIISVYARYQKGAEDELAKLYKERVEAKVSIYSSIGELQKLNGIVEKQSEEIGIQKQNLRAVVECNRTLEEKVDRIGRLEGTLATIINMLQGNTPDVGLQRVLRDVDPSVAKRMEGDIVAHVEGSA